MSGGDRRKPSGWSKPAASTALTVREETRKGIVLREGGGEPPLPDHLEALVAEGRKQSSSENTQRAYDLGWKTFEAWCARERVQALPATPKTVAAFVLACSADYKASSLALFLSGIAKKHQTEGFDPPPTKASVVRESLSAVRRRRGDETRRVLPLRPTMLRRIYDHSSTSARDIAMLVIAYAAALRESELVALEWPTDVTISREGMLLRLSGRTLDGRVKRAKTDQEAKGQSKAVRRENGSPLCPLLRLEAWLAVRGRHPGPLFDVSARTVQRIVKNAVERIGEDPSEYSGHSMRAGFVTELRARRASDAEITAVTLHTDPKTLRIYDRPEDLFEAIPTDIGLGVDPAANERK